MSEFETLPDLYDVLGVNADATDKELQKAFRQQAVKCHPDKNPTPEAAEHFHLLTIAIDKLTNAITRGEYDKYILREREYKLRRGRLDSARKAWIEELEKNEAVARNPSDRKRKWKDNLSKEEKLAQDGARLRAELRGRRKMSSSPDTPNSRIRGDLDSTVGTVRGLARHTDDTTISIRYRGTCMTAKDLRAIFENYGEVEEVVIRPTSKKTHSALLQFTNSGAALGASMASPDVLSTSEIEIRHVILVNNENLNIEHQQNTSQEYQDERRRTRGSTASEHRTTETDTKSFESTVLSKMRDRQRGTVQVDHGA